MSSQQNSELEKQMNENFQKLVDAGHIITRPLDWKPPKLSLEDFCDEL